MPKEKFKTIDEYIATFPKSIQKILEELRQVTRDSAPTAEEAISYQMPTFKLNGNPVWFAAFKNILDFILKLQLLRHSGKNFPVIKYPKAQLDFL